MGKVNELMCDYLGLTQYNADFWNGTEFQGKKKVKSAQLERHDREYHKTHQQKGKQSGVQRDVQMRWRGKKDIVLGVEIMETLDYTIPVRIMDYDAQELQRQIKDIGGTHKEAVKQQKEQWGSSGEFLYGMKKEDRLMPVHTVALYCGMEDYDGAKSILEMMDIENVEEEYQGLLQDYPAKIYSLKYLKEENFETSLREIIAIFKRSKDWKAMKEYYLAHKDRFRELDEISIDVMGALIGNSKLKIFQQEKGGVDMCKAFEDVKEEGRLEGRTEMLYMSIQNLMKNLKMTSQQAMEALGIPENEWVKYQQGQQM